jgi:excisionase family DNA binding protein
MTNPFEVIDARLSNIENLLLDIKHKPDPGNHPESDNILSIEQAANFLNLSKLTLYGKVSRRELPVSKRGKRLYFLRSELEQYIKSGHKKTVDELKMEASETMKRRRVL